MPRTLLGEMPATQLDIIFDAAERTSIAHGLAGISTIYLMHNRHTVTVILCNHIIGFQSTYDLIQFSINSFFLTLSYHLIIISQLLADTLLELIAALSPHFFLRQFNILSQR